MFLRDSIRRNAVYHRSKHVLSNGDHQPRTQRPRFERQCAKSSAAARRIQLTILPFGATAVRIDAAVHRAGIASETAAIRLS